MTTTPRDLMIVAMDMPSTRPVERGDLSLALAGAELIDLLGASAVRLDGDLVAADSPAPAPVAGPGDPLLEQASASLVREEPYESVNDWLWRRGRGLAAAYLAAFEAEGKVTGRRSRRWVVLWTSENVLVDSPDRTRAGNRWAADEPVLAALAAVIGITERRPGDYPGDYEDVADGATKTVLDAVTDAVGELAGERERRDQKRNDAAVTNYRRGY
ncbi:Golgi phosphoprotein 3 (GPP34) [Streptomyces sp. DvalAA-14]|uniref:GPP34 family phosphoprotein n=1 Tax=unclassified Streptomyces TaxID=2593676 RepID=UPI00081B3130|nr:MULTISPECIES: GPP34 family phosphoprotein [unclassified Streptomyces]MYS18882.1 GPP34 family phosphoprotein [Streptomyces sp. SID4948]SCD31113.1 Golgi phosphoprotein 3 (GPP34) [Streptomyces sp. DvalAA-14]